MAYINQEKKVKIAPEVKRICAKYGVKGSLSVDHHSTLCLTIKSGVLDFIGNGNAVMAQDPRALSMKSQPHKDYLQVNTYWSDEHFTGVVKEFLSEVIDAMNDGNHDNSDIQSDYFDVGWYININVGRWDKPYELVK